MSTPEGFSDNPLCAEMERRCAEMILVSQAVTTCADVFEQACEPRAPKPEWFGTGKAQWDSWMVQMREDSDWSIYRGSDAYRRSRTLAAYRVVPVAREGYPAPVGWKVVGE